MKARNYRVTMTFGATILGTFLVIAPNLKIAKQRAQTSKTLYVIYDKPYYIPANRIKVTTKFETED